MRTTRCTTTNTTSTAVVAGRDYFLWDSLLTLDAILIRTFFGGCATLRTRGRARCRTHTFTTMRLSGVLAPNPASLVFANTYRTLTPLIMEHGQATVAHGATSALNSGRDRHSASWRIVGGAHGVGRAGERAMAGWQK